MKDFNYIESAKRTIHLENTAIAELENRIDKNFTRACDIILDCKGRVVVSGMGKSGHIGRKIAATLASTGTPAFFVHPGEASHGDLGMITADDVVIAMSNSGSSAEVVALLPRLKRLNTKIIALTGKPNSPLGETADTILDIGVTTEACPLDLAPTSSTTVTLVMGDALAVALLEARGFTAEDFAFAHPGGALGRKLLLLIKDIMHSGEAVPVVKTGTSVMTTLALMSAKSFGIVAIVNDKGTLEGVFTDGDLRRCIDRDIEVKQTLIDQVMSTSPRTTTPNTLAAEAFNRMEAHKITAVFVVDEHNTPIGIVHMHDMLKAGLI